MTLIEPTMIEVTAGNGVVVRMDPLAFYAEALSCGLRDGTGTEAEAANLSALEKALATVAPETAEWTRSSRMAAAVRIKQWMEAQGKGSGQ